MATTITEEKPTKVKKYTKTSLIPCRSICNGVLYVHGPNSNSDVMFWNFGDVQDIQYQDLDAFIKRHATCVYKPQFIIEDENFIEQNPQIQQVYDSMYTKRDLKEVLSLPTSQMVKTINELPVGAKEAIKGLASSMIERGTLDSIEKVKALDEIFDTKLIFTVAGV